MEWWLWLLIIFGCLMVLMFSGMPVAFCFMLINVAGVIILWGGEAGLRQLSRSIFQSLNRFTLLPLALFLLMGSAMFRSKIGPQMIEAVDKLLGRLPGRLGLVAVAGGTLIATLSGSSAASTATLGSTLAHEMEEKGYKKPMSLGPILGSGGLAIMIPPSSLAVVLATIGEISLGKILVAIVIPGILMAALYAAYIILRCWLQPSIAPSYKVIPVSLVEKLIVTAKYILPLGFIVFLVIGVILLGIATPSEAAATGAVGVYILIAAYRRFNWKVVKDSVSSATRNAGFVLIILAGATAYAQILAYTGASKGLVEYALSLGLPPVITLIAMQVVGIILGGPLGATAVMMVTLPMFMPVVHALGFDPVWFGVIYLLNMEMSATSPPYGMTLFAMKGVAPPGTTMGDVFRAGLPFLGCDVIAMGLIIAFPQIALWLPSIMR